MTCIIGYLDKKNKCTWIGCDSLGSNGYTKAIELQPKIFRNKVFDNVVMGSTSTFRHIDLLKYSKDLFDEIDKYKDVVIDHEYMVTKFIPKVHKLLVEGIFDEDTKNKGANFIVGVDDKLFEIQNDYSVLNPELGFCSVGCGESVAMGSLITTKDDENTSIPDKIKKALECAEMYSCGVQRPFRIINTKDKEEIIIE
jgi:ATP-dependent protease HslVU (ClpYQ) peptidase subunit